MSHILAVLRQAGLKFQPSPSGLLRTAAPEIGNEGKSSSEAASAPALTPKPQPEKRLVMITDPSGLGAEKFRALSARLVHLASCHPIRIVQVTSSMNEEGKSTVAANLAIALARRTNSAVLLIEGDLRKPSLTTIIGVTATAGLTDWWQDGAKSIDGYLHPIEGLSLWLLPAGSHQPCDELPQFGAVREMLAALRNRFQWIIVDTPPMLPMADANLWANLVDGTLLVVRQDKTQRNLLQEGIQALDGLNLLGIVLNDSSDVSRASYYGGYYYGKIRTAEAVTSEVSQA